MQSSFLPMLHYNSIIRLPDGSLTTFIALGRAKRLRLVQYDRVDDPTNEVLETRYFADLVGPVFWFWELQRRAFMKIRRTFGLDVHYEISRLR